MGECEARRTPRRSPVEAGERLAREVLHKYNELQDPANWGLAGDEEWQELAHDAPVLARALDASLKREKALREENKRLRNVAKMADRTLGRYDAGQGLVMTFEGLRGALAYCNELPPTGEATEEETE